MIKSVKINFTMNSMQRIICFFLLLINTLLLQSCITAAGTAVVGGVVVYKRKAIEHFIDDKQIASEINQSYFSNEELWQENRVVVACVNGNVLLTGEVRTATLKQKAVNLAKAVPGISRVYDEIATGEPVSLLRQMLDSSITFIIKTKMIFAQDLDPSGIKVVTNNGVVYLMGVVHPEQADISSTIASKTSGVKKVVRVFQYIT